MLTTQDLTFIQTGADAFNSIFKDIPSEKAQEVKAALIAELSKEQTDNTPDSIVVTVDKVVAFVDCGLHYSTNAKAINIADSAKAVVDKLATGSGFFGLLGGLLHLNKAIKA